MSGSRRKQWPFFIVIGLMTLVIGFAIKNSIQPKYNPKQAAIATVIVHLPQKCALQGYLIMGTHLIGQMQIGEPAMRKLWDLAKRCGGRIEQVKEPESTDIYGPQIKFKNNGPDRNG